LGFANVKTNLALDLADIKSGTGYNYQTTIKKIYKVPKFPKDIDPSNCPALSMFVINMPRREFDEKEDRFNLMYVIMGCVSTSVDTDETGDVEDALLKLFEDIVDRFNKYSDTSKVCKLDEISNMQIIDGFIETQGNKGWIYIPIKFEFN
jgi:hypothetical protein